VQGFGFQWAWELAEAEEETLSYLRQELTWLKNTSVIPAGSWRLFAFYIPRNLVTDEGWSDTTIKEHIRSSASRAGVALHKITVMAVDSTANGTKWMTIGALGENRWYGLTPQELFNRMRIVNAVAGQAAGAEMEEMLDDLDIETTPVILSTPESKLPANTWYAALVMWDDVAMSEKEMADALDSDGMTLYGGIAKTAGSNGKTIMLSTGDRARTVSEITKLLGAKTVTVNLAAGKEGWYLDWAASTVNKGQDIGEAAAKLGEGLGGGIEALLGVGAGILSVLKYALYAAVPVALAYGGWRGYQWWKSEKRRRTT